MFGSPVPVNKNSSSLFCTQTNTEAAKRFVILTLEWKDRQWQNGWNSLSVIE